MSATKIERDVVRHLEEHGPQLAPSERAFVGRRVRELVADAEPRTDHDVTVLTSKVRVTVQRELEATRASEERQDARAADREAERERDDRRYQAEASASEATARLLTPPAPGRLYGLPEHGGLIHSTPPTDRKET